MKKFPVKYVFPILILAWIIYFTIEVFASQLGISGRTSTTSGGCNCHGANPSASTSISFVSGSLLVEPGSENSYTIRVSNLGKSKAGINIAVKTSTTGNTNVGMLTPVSGSGLQVKNNELTHASPKNFTSGNADFNFTWTAPTTPGIYYMRAAGNAVNADATSANDQWNFMPVQEVVVKGVQMTSPSGANLSYCVNNQVTISWTHVGVSNVKIELSTNGGNSWETTIAPSVSASELSYLWTIPASIAVGNQYKIRVSDAGNPNITSAMANNFGIVGVFALREHPGSKELCLGENLTLKVSLNGTANFQWMKNGSPILNANDSIYTINSVNASNAGSYSVVVSSDCQQDVTSNAAVVTVLENPIITVQPLSKKVCQGTNVVLFVTAEGQGLSYQWYFNDQLISNATESQYIIPLATAINSGAYYCNVINNCGTVKSNDVNLEVNEQPIFSVQPASKVVCEGDSIALSADASGSENIWEWYFNNQKLETDSSNILTIDNASASDSGEYYCVVINNCGQPQKSLTAVLTVNLKPAITEQPANKTVIVGNAVQFSVTAVNGSLTYKWRKNGNVINGAVDPTFEIASASKTDAGDYDCIVTNDCGQVTSSIAKLIVDEEILGAGIRFASESVILDSIFTDNSVDSVFTDFITNNGSSKLIISNIELIGEDAESFTVDIESSEIEAGESANLVIGFNPTSEGLKTASIKFTTNTADGMHIVMVTALATNFNLTTNTSLVDFEEVIQNEPTTLQFLVMNPNLFSVSLDSAVFDCVGDNMFEIVSPQLPVEIAAQVNQEVTVKFNTSALGSYDCNLILNFSGTNEKRVVRIQGTVGGSSVEDDQLIPLFKAVPNPGGDQLSFEFSLADASEYTLEIVNIEGIIVRSFTGTNGNESMKVVWDGKNDSGDKLPSGSYTARIRSGKGVKIINIILIK